MDPFERMRRQNWGAFQWRRVLASVHPQPSAGALVLACDCVMGGMGLLPCASSWPTSTTQCCRLMPLPPWGQFLQCLLNQTPSFGRLRGCGPRSPYPSGKEPHSCQVAVRSVGGVQVTCQQRPGQALVWEVPVPGGPEWTSRPVLPAGGEVSLFLHTLHTHESRPALAVHSEGFLILRDHPSPTCPIPGCHCVGVAVPLPQEVSTRGAQPPVFQSEKGPLPEGPRADNQTSSWVTRRAQV